jgi:hypothetical protein
VVAIDRNGNRSKPSKPSTAIPIEGTPPEPITIEEIVWRPIDGQLRLSVSWSARKGLELQILRKNQKSNRWKIIADWIDASDGSFLESNSEPYYDNQLMTKTRRLGGRLISKSEVTAITAYPY